jgi:hypothetical protein
VTGSSIKSREIGHANTDLMSMSADGACRCLASCHLMNQDRDETLLITHA